SRLSDRFHTPRRTEKSMLLRKEPEGHATWLPLAASNSASPLGDRLLPVAPIECPRQSWRFVATVHQFVVFGRSARRPPNPSLQRTNPGYGHTADLATGAGRESSAAVRIGPGVTPLNSYTR